MNIIEQSMYEITGYFLIPVLLLLSFMFLYALFELGRFGWESWGRWRQQPVYQPLRDFWNQSPQADQQDVELVLLKKIEPLRLVSRTAPMLGLVATMIPMGPALMGVANGNFVDVANQLVVAFAAVIVALLAASITFWILSVRRRWLLEELKFLLKQRSASEVTA
jgi:biopolymer transport protein ExbB/TolQ